MPTYYEDCPLCSGRGKIWEEDRNGLVKEIICSRGCINGKIAIRIPEISKPVDKDK